MAFFKKRSFVVSAAVGTVCALVLTALLLLPVAWAMIREVLPEKLGGTFAAAAAGVSVLVLTAVIVRSRGKDALATGGAVAGAYGVLAALLCALGGSGSAFGTWLAYLAAALVLGGLAGALVSVRRNAHRRRRR